MKNKYLVYCSVKWLDNKKIKLGKNYKFFYKKSELNQKNLKKFNPKYIYFPHWRYKIPKKIIKDYFCIIFHTSPLPFGRGGSPIQNLIKRGYNNSPIFALKASEKIDAGKIISKEKISLNGNLDQIFLRMSNKTYIMIKKIEKMKKVNLKNQKGKIGIFKRLKVKNNEIKEMKIKEIYNKIRMLDSKYYSKAFIKYKKLNIFFSNSKIYKNKIYCNSIIEKSKN